MRRESFERPATRSVKVMGTSTTVIPRRTACHVVSIWKA
jgi:hypothetical protein